MPVRGECLDNPKIFFLISFLLALTQKRLTYFQNGMSMWENPRGLQDAKYCKCTIEILHRIYYYKQGNPS
jgi:hypothetical protein